MCVFTFPGFLIFLYIHGNLYGKHETLTYFPFTLWRDVYMLRHSDPFKNLAITPEIASWNVEPATMFISIVLLIHVTDELPSASI